MYPENISKKIEELALLIKRQKKEDPKNVRINSDIYSTEFKRQVELVSDPILYKEIYFIFSKHIASLFQARKNKLKLAKFTFNEGEDVLNSLKLENDFLKIINITRLPLFSYLEYKSNSYKNAISLLEQTIVESVELQKDSDNFQILYFHRIQQFQNIARTHFKLEEYDTWKIIMRNMLLYMFNINKTITYKKTNIAYFSVPNVELFDLMLDQMVRESIKFPQLVGDESMLSFIIDGISQEKYISSFHKDVVLWIELKNKLFKNKLDISSDLTILKKIFLSTSLSEIYKTSILEQIKDSLIKQDFSCLEESLDLV